MNIRQKYCAALCTAALVMASPALGAGADQASLAALGRELRVGDVVFVRIPFPLFTKVADTTNSWTNHVGIVIDDSGTEPVIAESRFPLSGQTTWQHFVARSEQGRVAVGRVAPALDPQQRARIAASARARFAILYDTGFDLHSPRQFCSRFVREVLDEALSVRVGRVGTFGALLASNPRADIAFWRTWYFGYIPWQRETVTPASLLNDPALHKIFDGRVTTEPGSILTGASK